jgi:ferritin
MAEISQELFDAITAQAQVELSAHVLYLQAAYWFEDRKLTGFAKHLKHEAASEHEHFRKLLDYAVLRGRQSEVAVPTVQSGKTWANEVEAAREVLATEENNYQCLMALTGLARRHNDYDLERFVQDELLKEQVKSVFETQRFVRQVEGVSATPGLIWWLDERQS